VTLGIGDDAAVLAPFRHSIVVTVDASVEDVHFRRRWMGWEDVGYRATVAAASDVLAMGARPTVAVAAWTIPPDLAEADVDAIARGQRAAADALGLAFVGGNLASGPCVSITTTVLGEAARPVARAGARVGDRIGIYGPLGLAALGLAALERGVPELAPDGVARFRRPPVHLGANLATAHAAIDVSDGLAQDVGHLARASGVRVVLELARLQARRVAAHVAQALAVGVDLDRLELSGGEDYALVAAFDVVPEGFDDIGFVEAGEGVELLSNGGRTGAPPGYVHR
jgi:thiamine-monophosphate kinase